MARLSSVLSFATIAAVVGMSQISFAAIGTDLATLDPGLTGNTQTDGWYQDTLKTGTVTTTDLTTGVGSFSGGDATLTKISGPAFPSSSSIYFGYAGTSSTFVVSDTTPVANLSTVVFQIQIGQAYGDDFVDDILPTLSYNGGSQNIAADTSIITEQVQNGTFMDEPLYITIYTLVYDLSDISESITSFDITFSGVLHAQLYQLRLDQSDEVYAAVPEPAAISLLALGAGAMMLRRRH